MSKLSHLPDFTPSKTWILVANRTHARILERNSDRGALTTVQHIEFPDGRLKNREIDTDRSSGGVSTSGPAYPVHGLVNKGEAHFHLTQVFARDLTERLKKARASRRFTKLVLVAEDRFLGELLASLDDKTKSMVVSTVHKDIAGMKDNELVSRVAEFLD